jgi:uncharacterized membrane protein
VVRDCTEEVRKTPYFRDFFLVAPISEAIVATTTPTTIATATTTIAASTLSPTTTTTTTTTITTIITTIATTTTTTTLNHDQHKNKGKHAITYMYLCFLVRVALCWVSPSSNPQ